MLRLVPDHCGEAGNGRPQSSGAICAPTRAIIGQKKINACFNISDEIFNAHHSSKYGVKCGSPRMRQQLNDTLLGSLEHFTIS
jgi:hypothetical protein